MIKKSIEEDNNGNSNKEDSGSRSKISKIINSIVIEKIFIQIEVVFVVGVAGAHHKNKKINMTTHLVHQITRKEIKVTRIEDSILRNKQNREGDIKKTCIS